jgi:hypothetical protein
MTMQLSYFLEYNCLQAYFFKTYGTAPALSLKSQPVKEQKDISSRYPYKVSGFEVPLGVERAPKN